MTNGWIATRFAIARNDEGGHLQLEMIIDFAMLFQNLSENLALGYYFVAFSNRITADTYPENAPMVNY